MSNVIRDLHYNLRVLRKSPGFVVVAVLAIAFGTGVNAAVFTLLNAIALRPLPVKNAGDVVTIYQSVQQWGQRNVHGDDSFFSYPEYVSYRDSTNAFSGLAVYASAGLTLGGAEPHEISGDLVSCNYFEVLTGELPMGRAFRADECGAPGGSPVAVMSRRLWQTQFGGDAQILGKSIVVNGTRFTVVGVAPDGFNGASLLSADLWTPLTMQEQWIPGRKFLNDANLSWLQMVGRLKAGFSITQATANAAVVAGRIDQEHQPRKTTLQVSRATLMNVPEAHTILLGGGVVVLTAVSLVLLIACANLANLLMARAADRQKEIAIRLAMGARRRQIFQQLLAESLSLSLVGGALGLLAAWGILKTLLPMVIAQLPPEVGSIAMNVDPDPRIIAYLLMLSFASGVGFGLLPALQATRFDLNGALKESGTIFGRIGRHRLRNTLVAVQVAVCMILLIGAGLLARGLRAVQTIEPGFRLQDIAVGTFDLNRQGYDAARSAAFHDELARRLATRGIQSSLVSPVPLNGSRTGTDIRLEGRQDSVNVFTAAASSSYFQLVEIPIVRGRPFNDAEVRSEANVVLVSESTARRLWPGENAVGQRFSVGRQTGSWEVVGIARDVHSTGLSQADETLIYFPPRNESRLRLAILARGESDSGAVLRSIREEAAAIDANVMVRTNSLDDNLNLWQFPARITAALGSILGIAGLLLASMGIYGVVAYAVGRRTREIGIRMSLGANRSDVIRMILIQTMRPVVVGGVIGVAGGAALSGILRNVFFGVRLLDPIVFGGVAIFLTLVALLVSYAPARRAAGVDPLVALRHE